MLQFNACSCVDNVPVDPNKNKLVTKNEAREFVFISNSFLSRYCEAAYDFI